MTDHIVLVRTSPRIPIGLLSADGWAALHSGPVYAHDPAGEDLARAVQAAGIDVWRLDVPEPPGGPLLAPPLGVSSARALRAIAATGGGVVVWLLRPEGDAELSSALADLAAREGGVSIEVVVASWDPPGARLLDAVAVMDRLRAPGGCPWDAAQTHASLAPYLIEEAHEAADALATENSDALREELGDVLLQVLFHARLAEEIEDDDERWTIDDVAGGLVEKLVRRHPHVFAGLEVSGAEEVHANWDQLKQAEKAGRSVVDGVPVSAPSLARAGSLVARAARAGLPSPETASLPEQARTPSGLGAHLLGLVTAATHAGLDPEGALRAAILSYAASLREAEELAGRADPAHGGDSALDGDSGGRTASAGRTAPATRSPGTSGSTRAR
ncbi:MAG: MazG family protein [Geodermatophilaceae bacterium]|nr:MazG family protein [Geodermatophilaceae bacterium]